MKYLKTKIKWQFLFLLWTGAGLLTGCEVQDNRISTIIGKHVIRLTEPPGRIPSKYSVDAPVVGNGFMGAAIAGKPEKQIFYVARNDFWRLKSGHNESYPALLGKVEISIPALEGASYLVEQDLFHAVITARFNKDGNEVTIRFWQAATDDVMPIEISMTGKGALEGNFGLSLPGNEEIVEQLPLDRAFPEQREVDEKNGVFYAIRAFQDSVDIPTRAAIALIKVGAHDTTPLEKTKFVLQQGQPVTFVCATSSNFKSENPKNTAVSKAETATANLKSLEKQHFDWWKEYWEKSWVSIPDTAIERLYYLSLYGTASTSRDKDFPPGLFGTWITCEQPAWQGDYHLNYNFQAPFYALYSANRLEQTEPFYSPILAFMERGKYYSGKIADIPDGVIYPVGIGPLGIETTLWTPFMAEHASGWWKTIAISQNIEYDGMFWGQKSDASYCVANMSMHFYRTWDRDFASYVYPFVKATATFWEKYVKWENGRYVIYNDAVHEATVGDFNPILSLGFVRQTMQTALDMSELLNVDAERRAKWTDVRDNISDYPLMERDGKTVFRLTEKGIAVVDGNSLAIQHIYPGGQIGLDSSPELLQISRNTLQHKDWLDMNASNSIFPTAVRIGIDPDTIIYHLNRYVKHTFPNGFQLDNPHGVENWSTVPNTINEMLCMGHQDVVRLFPVWPRNKDAEFYHIRVEGAFLVSAALKKGEVENLTIFSEQGRDLCLLNPWPGHDVVVKEKNGGETTESGERIRISTKPDKTYFFKKAK